MKGLVIALLLIGGGGLLVLELQFGTVAPCGILRAELRQEAAREGGFALVAAALPDSAINALLAAQFGPMSPGRCLQLAISGPPMQTQASPSRPNPEQVAAEQARTRAMQLAKLRNLIEQMGVFTTRANAMLPKFAQVEQRYQYITERMRGALASERAIYGDGQAAVARSQISVAITQASIQANQIHIDVQSSYRDFEFRTGQLEREATGASQGCRGAHIVTNTAPIPAGFEDSNSACLNFFDIDRQFQNHVSRLRAAFSQIETVWRTARQQQDEIVQASNAAAE